MLIHSARVKRGDTIIEVMFAFVIFSLVVVGSVMLMNKGIALAQQSLEITQVRSQIDAQITMIKYLQQQTDDTIWRQLLANEVGAPVDSFGGTSSCPTVTELQAKKAFFLARKGSPAIIDATSIGPTSYQDAVAYSIVDQTTLTPKAYGMWVQLAKAEGAGAYDVHVRACWGSIGASRPMMIGTVVRLYDIR